MLRRTLLSATLAISAAALLLPGTGAAVTHSKIGPHQYFAGSVNGSLGVPQPAVIKVVCPGPVGTTGHPLAGQTLEVGPSPAAVADVGYTGTDATEISAFFGAPPPSAGPGAVVFKRYGVAKAIPTSLELPCGGTGQVTFVPFPEGPPVSRAATVPVVYANVAVTPAL
jgi:hypothetical protein